MNRQNQASRAASKVSAREQILDGEFTRYSEKECPDVTVGSTETALLSGLDIKQGTEKQNRGTQQRAQPEYCP